MKKLLGCAGLALALAGCCANTDIAYVKSGKTLVDGEKPRAEITVQNVGYSLFGCIPIESGRTWKGEQKLKDRPHWNATWFENRCTPEENLLSLKAALKEVGSNRVENFVERSESWASWSVWIIWQTMETTTCTVLEPTGNPATAKK